MEDILPTARWGNRMLRPLNSIYHRLRKYQETRCPEANQKRINDGVGICAVQRSRSRSTRPVIESDPFSDSEVCGDDPSWIPGKIGKRQIKHKYTGRGEGGRGRTRMKSILRSPETQKPLPGAIEIATPLIIGKPTGRLFEKSEEPVSPCERRGTSLSPSPIQQSGPEKKARFSKQSKMSERGSQWEEILDMCDEPEYIQIVHRLDRVFLRFLTSTRVSESATLKNHEKTRPLLSIVLRRLPHFISQEQQLQDSLDDDDLDMADVYFTQLEASYCFGNPAWPPLREAVRSQGIFLVLDMIQKHWITNLIACGLVEKCIHSEEYDAVETLLSGQLLNIRYDYPDSFDPWRPHELRSEPLMILNKYWRSSGRISYTFNELAKLLLRGAVPAEWMVTNPWNQCMHLATESISMEDGNSAAATRLIEAVILSGSGIFHGPDRSRLLAEPASSNCSSPRNIRSTRNDNGLRSDGPCPLPIQNALNNLVSSLITALCGMHFVRSYAIAGNITACTTKIENLVKGLAIAVQREIGLRPFFQENKIFDFHSLRCGYVLLGTYLLQCGHLSVAGYSTDPILTDNLEPFFQWLASQQELVNGLASLVSQVVRCCKRGNEREQSQMSQHLCANLTRLRLFEMRSLSLFLGRVAVDVAMDFAQSSQDPEDHAWAADLQEKVAGYQRQYAVLSQASSSPQCMERNTRPFRWEESISEWVASTPAPKMKNLQPYECLKPIVLIPKKLPSHAELSSSSTDSASSFSGDQASSVTSSVSSLSLKRVSTDDVFHPRTEKRARILRSTRVSRLRQSRDNKKSIWDGQDDDTADEVENHNRTISTSRATGEQPSTNTSTRNGCTHQFSSSDMKLKSNLSIMDSRQDSGIEVVIFINQKPDLPSMETAVVRGSSLPPKPQITKPPADSTARLLPKRRRTVVPYTEDEESEDELCL
jgi:hypothetical protein